jgi:hypothetical protein
MEALYNSKVGDIWSNVGSSLMFSVWGLGWLIESWVIKQSHFIYHGNIALNEKTEKILQETLFGCTAPLWSWAYFMTDAHSLLLAFCLCCSLSVTFLSSFCLISHLTSAINFNTLFYCVKLSVLCSTLNLKDKELPFIWPLPFSLSRIGNPIRNLHPH